MSAVQALHDAFAPSGIAPSALDLSALPGRAGEAAVWRGTDIARSSPILIPTGFPALDAQLGGGWPGQSLTELLQPQSALCEWRLLSPSLRHLVAAGGTVYLVGPPKRPHAPGLRQLGLPSGNVVWIAADKPVERLWVTEQLVKANPAGAVLTWLPQAQPEQLRRLQVHAASCDAPVFVFRPEQAQRDASPAPLRLIAALGPDWTVRVQILKRKGGHFEGTLILPAIPGILATVLPPRLQGRFRLVTPMESVGVNHALGSITD